MSGTTSGLAQSVHTRLIRHAQSLGVDPNLVLTRFATERLLYRLSRSRHAERFVLKGALLLFMWLGETIRPTRDADLLGFGDVSDETLAATFAEVRAVNVEPVLGAAARAGDFRFVWQPGGPWMPSPRREGVAS
ncbi:MAG: nucleotidyl transferase AbiEii/AbiGii toxin family protein [Firmicutes bacterium]|nr:nucleotidyl transferase AbiEii/AbiGii toxin family protein [Bacillota bacterium]MDH7495336.1 nucleotidyl transferase AbiEii/AbiGii toxin family protein [Bacillota bacterium]